MCDDGIWYEPSEMNLAGGYAKIGVVRSCHYHHSSPLPHERRRIHATRGGGEEGACVRRRDVIDGWIVDSWIVDLMVLLVGLVASVVDSVCIINIKDR